MHTTNQKCSRYSTSVAELSAMFSIAPNVLQTGEKETAKTSQSNIAKNGKCSKNIGTQNTQKGDNNTDKNNTKNVQK